MATPFCWTSTGNLQSTPLPCSEIPGAPLVTQSSPIPPPLTPPVPPPGPRSSTWGYYSVGQASGTTSYGSATYNVDSYIHTSGDYLAFFPLPSVDSNDRLMTNGCSMNSQGAQYLSGPSFSSQCVFYCVYHTVYESYGASSSRKRYTCGDKTTGLTIYVKSPVQSMTETPTPSTMSTLARNETFSTPPPKPPSQEQKPRNNAGVIAGAVIGGISILGIVILGVIFLLLRHKRANKHAIVRQSVAQGDLPEYMGK